MISFARTRCALGLATLGVVVAGFGAVALVDASTVEPMSLAQMSERAQLIFTGRVIEQRTGWNVSRTRLYTYTTFEVDRYLKGGSGAATVEIRVWGGQVGQYRVMVSGAPSFGQGEEVLLFLGGGGAQMLTPLGMSLGKFTLSTNADGARVVKRDIRGLMFERHRSDSTPIAKPRQRFLLSDVESEIRAALEP